jgi:peptidoglycan/xylan/chitin deacetylase (PgdA/CDA1 family)
LKKILTPALSGFTNLIPQGLIEKLCGQFTPIFMLHRLANDNKVVQQQYHKHLSWCFEYLHKHHYKPLSLFQLAQLYQQNLPVPAKSVVFTLDDGFYDQYELAAPLFSQYDIPYTCFLITDFIDQKLWPWDDQLSYIVERTPKKSVDIKYNDGQKENIDIEQFNHKAELLSYFRNKVKQINQSSLYSWIESLYPAFDVDIPSQIPEQFKPMTWDNAQTMINQGHDIAPHTVTHRILSQLDDATAKHEIETSKQRVENKLEGSKPVFAFPTGRSLDFTSRDENIVKKAGFLCSVSTTPEATTKKSNIFQLPRYSLPENKFDFIQYLSFFESLKRHLKS